MIVCVSWWREDIGTSRGSGASRNFERWRATITKQMTQTRLRHGSIRHGLARRYNRKIHELNPQEPANRTAMADCELSVARRKRPTGRTGPTVRRGDTASVRVTSTRNQSMRRGNALRAAYRLIANFWPRALHSTTLDSSFFSCAKKKDMALF